MNRLLLSLWLLGAALYAGNTLLYSNVIVGWPKQKVETDAHKETATTTTVAKMQDRQFAEIAESQSPAAPSQPTAEPKLATGAQPQGKHAPGLDSTARAPLPNGASTAPLPSMPQAQPAPGVSAQQQLQSTPPDGSVLSSRADVAPAPSAQDDANSGLPTQHQSTPQPKQATSAEASGAAQDANVGQQQSQSGWVKVLGSPAGMRSSPSQSAPILFAFPEGRELRVVSRRPGWVQVKDPASKQSGWVPQTSLIDSNGQVKQQQVSGALPQGKQAARAQSRRQQAFSAPPQRRQIKPQRPRRDAGPRSYDSAEGPPPIPRGRWVPWDPDMGPPAVVEEFEDRPPRWWRRRGGFAFRGD
jgi:Bacterial SH3 domain